jgi:hypothetical protein
MTTGGQWCGLLADDVLRRPEDEAVNLTLCVRGAALQ